MNSQMHIPAESWRLQLLRLLMILILVKICLEGLYLHSFIEFYLEGNVLSKMTGLEGPGCLEGLI